MTSLGPNAEPSLTAALKLDEHAGPATRISRERARDLVQGALDAWPLTEVVEPSWRKRLSRTQVAAAAALLLFAMGSGASAALWVWGKRVEDASEAAQPSMLDSVELKVRPTVIRDSLREMDESVAADSDAASESNERVMRRPQRGTVVSEDSLQRANRLRAEGQFSRARDAYADVAKRFPRTLAAYAAQVAEAELELEHLGRPAVASRLFQRALSMRPKGALSIEALQGMASSARALGHRGDEVKALTSLLRLAPAGAVADRARLRLAQLEGER